MAANPPLVRTEAGLVPAPYANEWIGLGRSGVEIRLEGLPDGPARWDRRGTVFVTNLRLVFVGETTDPKTGLLSYDLPLSYISHHSFNQPILGCNNLKGQCWTVDQGPGHGRPLQWTVYFKCGGVGTFLPLFHSYIGAYSELGRAPSRPVTPATQTPGGGGVSTDDCAPSAPPKQVEASPPSFLRTALVDANDPTKVYLTQPVREEDRLKDVPNWPLL